MEKPHPTTTLPLIVTDGGGMHIRPSINLAQAVNTFFPIREFDVLLRYGPKNEKTANPRNNWDLQMTKMPYGDDAFLDITPTRTEQINAETLKEFEIALRVTGVAVKRRNETIT
jgi:phosphotransferase system HPr-like phosphotransfer protein